MSPPRPSRSRGDARRFAGVTVDVVVLTIRQGRLSVLLIERDTEPHRGRWALPGGFVEPDEDLPEAARRVLASETGLSSPSHLEQLRTYGDPGRDPRGRVVTVAYLAFVPSADAPRAGDGDDRNLVRFWAVEDLEGEDAPELAFDHARIVADAVERARAKLEYTTLATSFVEEPFTIAELRRVYEAAWGVSLEPNNFRRKVLSTDGFVVPTGRSASGGRGKPATLYRRGTGVLLHPAMLRPGSEHRTEPGRFAD